MGDVTTFRPGSLLGAISRRQMLYTVGAGASSALAVLALPPSAVATASAQAAANKSFPVTTVNHLSYPSTNYKQVRDFYVDLLGMRVVWDDNTKCQVDCGPPA